MDKKAFEYKDFFSEVSTDDRDFVNQMHRLMLENDCKTNIKLVTDGYVVSYTLPKSRRVVFNLMLRKDKLFCRIYGDNVNKYLNFMQTLPAEMMKAIETARVCKRLSDPEAHSSRCPMGYDFTIRDTRHKKCRYKSFMFAVNSKNNPFIRSFVENELHERLCCLQC